LLFCQGIRVFRLLSNIQSDFGFGFCVRHILESSKKK
jgi:hypothetical protein